MVITRRSRQKKTHLGSRAIYLLKRNIYTSCGKLNESVTKLGMLARIGFDAFANIASPLIRRIHPQLFSQNIVAVQPMTRPIGLAFAMRFVYQGIEQFNELV